MLNTMRNKSMRGIGLLWLLLALTLLVSGVARAATLGPANGSLFGSARTFNLWAKAGTTVLPDGASVNVWGYTDTADGAVTAPGGPVLIVNQGETVVVNLTNNLSAASGMLFQGQSMVPDSTGAGATNGTRTYTFIASSPGTFLYEAAGLIGGSNTDHQAAMGLYGALIVRPTSDGTATGTPLPMQAYADAATTFVDEALLVLGEIDPAFSAAPAAFDLRNFAPRYFLINGKAYPATALVPSAAGNKVLLRFVNAGAKHHSMAALGLQQLFVAKDAGPLPTLNHKAVAETIPPGQTADSVVTIPLLATADSKFAVYDANLSLRNSNAAGFGGMLTFLTAGASAPTGPVVTALSLAGSNLSATITASTGTVAAAEYWFDSVTPHTAITVTAGATVNVTDLAVALPTSNGTHVLYVRGQDSTTPTGIWGAPRSVAFVVDTAGPITSALALSPNPSIGTLSGVVTLSATANDSATGGSNITSAEYTIDGGTPVAMTLVGAAAPVRGLTATIPAGLAPGPHVISVRSQDAVGNLGAPATITLNVVSDTAGPLTSGLSLTPNPSDGTVSVALSASGNDTTTGGSNIAGAEYFIGPVGANGSGAAMTLAGTASPVSALSATILPPITGGAVSVHSRDAVGNWGPFATIALVTPPVTTQVSAAPNPNNGALPLSATQPFVRVSATVAGMGSTVVAAEGFLCTAPALNCTAGAPGSGFPFVPSDGVWNGASESVYADIPLVTINGLSTGNHTIYVRGKNAGGVWSATASTTLFIDKAAPAFTGITLAPSTIRVGTATVALTVNGSTDPLVAGLNSGVVGGEWWIGTTNISAGTGTPFTGLTPSIDTSALAGGSYTVRVRIRDAAGNWSTGTNGVRTATLRVVQAVANTYTTTIANNAAGNSASQTFNVSQTNGVLTNDQPTGVNGRTATPGNPVVTKTPGGGSGTMTVTLAIDGSFSYTITTTATGPVNIRAAKRGTYQFTYTETLNGVSDTATVTINVN